MPTSATPRVFVSHASEDKQRFVIPFAQELRRLGIDAWVDEWEIGPGDSLALRIFDDGIEPADAFIVVLSLTSVGKPWVREELDAAVVRRIQSERVKLLIPIILDEGVVVPPPLQHLLWESVPKTGFDVVTQRIVDRLYGRQTRPPLGSRPRYLDTRLVWTEDPQDEAVFNLIVDELRAHDSAGWMLFSNDVQRRAEDLGISREAFFESMHALGAARRINAEMMAGGVRWMLRPLSDHTWLELERDRGVDVIGAKRTVLAAIVNRGVTTFAPGDYDLGWHALGAVLRGLQSDGLLHVHGYGADSKYSVSGVSPLAGRALRNLEH